MAFHTLSVIGSQQAGFEWIFRVKWFAVAADALRRFPGSRAVVVTALTNRSFLVMKVVRQFIGTNVIDHCLNYFAVW